jgi:hypothetical protein
VPGGGQAARLGPHEVGRLAEPGEDPGHGLGVDAARPLLLDPAPQPADEIKSLVLAQNAVGEVGRPADVVQNELVGALDHVAILLLCAPLRDPFSGMAPPTTVARPGARS